MLSVLIRGELRPHAQREGYMMMGAEIAGTHLQAKKCPGVAVTRRALRALQGTHSATLISDLGPTEP